jgi:hypothetical protein
MHHPPYARFSNGVGATTNVTFAGIKNSTVETLGGFSLESFCAVGTVAQGSATNPISIKGIPFFRFY